MLYTQRQFKLSRSYGIDDFPKFLELTSWDVITLTNETNYWLNGHQINLKIVECNFFNWKLSLEIFTEDPRRCWADTAYNLESGYPRMPQIIRFAEVFLHTTALGNAIYFDNQSFVWNHYLFEILFFNMYLTATLWWKCSSFFFFPLQICVYVWMSFQWKHKLLLQRNF